MNALVLSGGGGRGAYQIGVWKALRELRYDFDIITGTSVGSLNAMLIIQNSIIMAPLLWNKLDFSKVFQDDLKKEQSFIDMIITYSKGFIKNRGLNPDNLEKIINKTINCEKIYSSKINFGLVTYDLTTLKPKKLTKKDIPKEKLKDFLIASCAAFPAIKLKKIDKHVYLDGGFYDLVPINLAIDMGATNIIAVDLKCMGIRRKLQKIKAKITYIYPRNNIGYLLQFSKNTNKRNIKYGYNDTMKTFGLLEGDKYTFKKNTLTKLSSIYLTEVKETLVQIFKNKNYILDLLNDYDILKNIEKLGNIFNIPNYEIYSINKFNTSLKKELKNIRTIDNIKTTTKKKEIIKYLYLNIINKNINILEKYYKKYQIEFIYACYLFTVIEGVYRDV